MVTLPSVRGKGLGKALLRELEKIARRNGQKMGLVALARSIMSSPLQLANSHFRSGESEGGLGG